MSGTLVKNLQKSLVKTMGISFEKNPSSTSDKVYAIIYGTPTNTDKVWSDFSNSNYLRIGESLPTDSTEIVIDFTLGTSKSGTQTIFYAGIFALTIYSNYLGTYDNGASGYKTIIPASDLVVNSHYVVRVEKNDRELSFYYSKDGGDFVNSLNWTSPNNYLSYILIGKSSTTNRYFRGSIDLNNTYVKIGNKIWFNGDTKSEE